VSERDHLLAILRRVRRRLRALAALQGAVVGLGAALLASAVWLAVARWRGPVGRPVAGWGSALLAVIGVGLLGAGLAALRRVPLQNCARALDRLWAGSDRMLSALAFLEQAPTAFTRAAIKDAVDRALVVAPTAVAPLRRPHGVAALGLGAAVALVAAFAPFPRHAGRAAAKGTTGPAPVSATVPIAAPLQGSDLEAERQEARAAQEAAKALGDPTLEAAAAALSKTIADLTVAGTGRGEALDRLAALQDRSEQAARDAEALAAGLRRAGEAMASTKETRALGDGLTAGNPAATAESASDLAARVERSTAAGRESLARALERAAEQAGRESSGGSGSGSKGGGDQKRAAGAGGGDEDSQRRLQRESSAQDQAGGDDSGAENGPSERHLQRLERDLHDTANACRENPAACQQHLRDRARSLPKMQQESRGAEARRNLARAVQQLRERLQREGQSDHGNPSEKQRQRQEQRRFARAADGQRGAAGGSRSAGNGGGEQGEENDESGESSENGEGDGDEMADDSSGGNSRSGTPGGSAAGDSTGGGARGENGGGRREGPAEQAAEGGNGGGIGDEGGGQALGRQKDLRAARGKEREAAVRSAAGPNRSSVIQSAAARGFAHGDYRRVYQDYDAVMEESLDATAVPPGQRYLVRRYFQLIRPRSATARATTTATPRTTNQPGGPPP
jgi:hypothetical protein